MLFPSADAAKPSVWFQSWSGITPGACTKPSLSSLLRGWWQGGDSRLLFSLPLSLLQQQPTLFIFIYFPLSVNQQGSQQRDAALIRVIRLIYERVAQWRRAFLIQCSPWEAGHPPAAGSAVLGLPASSDWRAPFSSTSHISERGQTHAINAFFLHVIFFTSCMFHINIRSLIKVIKERDPSLVLTKCMFWLIKDSWSKFAVSLEGQELLWLCSSSALWKFSITFIKGLCMMS